MRIAIPVWNDRISPVLDTASKLLIVEVDEQKESARFEIFLDEHELARRCVRICGMKVDVLICGAISRPFYRMLTASGLDIIHDIAGHPEKVLKTYLQDKVLGSDFLMPGCKGGREKCNEYSPAKTGKKKKRAEKSIDERSGQGRRKRS